MGPRGAPDMENVPRKPSMAPQGPPDVEFVPRKPDRASKGPPDMEFQTPGTQKGTPTLQLDEVMHAHGFRYKHYPLQSSLPKAQAMQDHDGQEYYADAHEMHKEMHHKVSDENINAFDMTLDELQEESGSTSHTSSITSLDFSDSMLHQLPYKDTVMLTALDPDTYFEDPKKFNHFWKYLDYVWVPYEQYYDATDTSISQETKILVDNMREKGIKIRAYQQGIPAELSNDPKALTWAACRLLGKRGPMMKDVVNPASSVIANVHKLARMVGKLPIKPISSQKPRHPSPQEISQPSSPTHRDQTSSPQHRAQAKTQSNPKPRPREFSSESQQRIMELEAKLHKWEVYGREQKAREDKTQQFLERLQKQQEILAKKFQQLYNAAQDLFQENKSLSRWKLKCRFFSLNWI